MKPLEYVFQGKKYRQDPKKRLNGFFIILKIFFIYLENFTLNVLWLAARL